MSQEEGILPVGPAARGAAVWEAAVREAAVQFMSCRTAQAIIYLKAAAPSLRMFRQFPCLRWNIWGSVLIAEGNNGRGGWLVGDIEG